MPPLLCLFTVLSQRPVLLFLLNWENKVTNRKTQKASNAKITHPPPASVPEFLCITHYPPSKYMANKDLMHNTTLFMRHQVRGIRLSNLQQKSSARRKKRPNHISHHHLQIFRVNCLPPKQIEPTFFQTFYITTILFALHAPN